MSYGANFKEAWRLVGAYAARILKGDKPADLPVQETTKFQLTVNLVTRLLGLDVSPSLIARAKQVIE